MKKKLPAKPPSPRRLLHPWAFPVTRSQSRSGINAAARDDDDDDDDDNANSPAAPSSIARERDRVAGYRCAAADQPGALAAREQAARDAPGAADPQRDLVAAARHGRVRGRREDVCPLPRRVFLAMRGLEWMGEWMDVRG